MRFLILALLLIGCKGDALEVGAFAEEAPTATATPEDGDSGDDDSSCEDSSSDSSDSSSGCGKDKKSFDEVVARIEPVGAIDEVPDVVATTFVHDGVTYDLEIIKTGKKRKGLPLWTITASPQP